MEAIPPTAQLLLPPVTLTVQDFLAYELLSIAPNTRFIWPDKYLSTVEPNVNNIDEITALATPPDKVVESLHGMDRLRAKSIICPHEMSAGGKHYPMWWLRDLGTDLGFHHHSQLVTISNINKNHWGAIIVDFNQKSIRYGDSMERPINAGVKAALNWWLYFHTGQTFTYAELLTTHQQDSHSCGILAWNALAHYFFPKRYPLLDASHMQDAQLHMLLKILGFSKPELKNDNHQQWTDPMSPPFSTKFDETSNGSDVDSDTYSPPSTPKQRVQQLSILTSLPSNSSTPIHSPYISPSLDENSVKRKFSSQATHTPPTSPRKKKGRIQTVSAMWQALTAGKHSGLLMYFKQSAKGEHVKNVTRVIEELCQK
ncbi:hypothetical protein K443DRAFT_3607 [Laccaria amethystina LaAM-08-1]|uniref:Ubiquitin-like protease family profile domain-containing protein n=1 Tax=Laccaria amethystina LaAM-08-1 TaxID=1095629 RepID=A0A0C9XLB1_9AGAR|nr:hypothetical protein K443DRAFT_3607 [Laccaria amethystina LaAM-08-1]